MPQGAMVPSLQVRIAAASRWSNVQVSLGLSAVIRKLERTARRPQAHVSLGRCRDVVSVGDTRGEDLVEEWVVESWVASGADQADVQGVVSSH